MKIIGFFIPGYYLKRIGLFAAGGLSMMSSAMLLSIGLLAFSGRMNLFRPELGRTCMLLYLLILFISTGYAAFIHFYSRTRSFHKLRSECLRSGFVHSYSGDCVEAIRNFRKVLLFVPNDRPASAAVAVMYMRLGNQRKFRQYLRRMEDADGCKSAWKSLIWLLWKST